MQNLNAPPTYRACHSVKYQPSSHLKHGDLRGNLLVNPLRAVNAYMHQGIKYFTVHKQIIITSPPFTL